MALNGISGLVGVTQLKADNANQDAMAGAKKQSSLVSLHQALHAAAAKFEQMKAGGGTLETLRRRFDDATKDLESQDKLGNFEIQDLMSRYNQAETLASSVHKKQDGSANSVIGKI